MSERRPLGARCCPVETGACQPLPPAPKPPPPPGMAAGVPGLVSLPLYSLVYPLPTVYSMPGNGEWVKQRSPRKLDQEKGDRMPVLRPQGSEWGGQEDGWRDRHFQIRLILNPGEIRIKAAAPILGPGSLSCGQQVWRPEEQGIICGCLLYGHPGIILRSRSQPSK